MHDADQKFAEDVLACIEDLTEVLPALAERYERMVVVTALAEHVAAALQLFLELRLCSAEQARQVLDRLEEAAFSEPELFFAALRPPH